MEKKKYLKKVLKYVVLMLLVVLLWGSRDTGAKAASTSGQCGDEVYWEYDERIATLTISGTGDMWDFGDENGYPKWRYDYAESIKKIVVKAGVTRIGNYAFAWHENVKQVVLPIEGLLSIGERAFNDCKSLTEITIPEGVESIGEYAFCDCEKLKSITLPQSLKEIGAAAFYWCSSLKNIILPDGLESIPSSAFARCYYLESVEIPNSVKKMQY